MLLYPLIFRPYFFFLRNMLFRGSFTNIYLQTLLKSFRVSKWEAAHEHGFALLSERPLLPYKTNPGVYIVLHLYINDILSFGEVSKAGKKMNKRNEKSYLQ